MIKDIWSGVDGSFPGLFTSINQTLFFAADDGVLGRNLWKSDGTMEGTFLIKEFARDIYGPWNLTDVNDTLFFTVRGVTHRTELWRSDGTTEGTFLVKDVWPESRFSEPRNLTDIEGTLIFTTEDGNSRSGTLEQ